jgi:glucose-1-phosphate cytidylyltransferase
MILHNQLCEPWTVTLVNTGTSTSTGGRLKRIHEYVKSEDAFCFTYGDGVGNIAVNDLVKFHNNNNVLVTVTAVPSPSRFGALEINQHLVTGFIEKPVNSNILINAGFFVMSPKALDFIENDNTSWEEDTLKLFIEQNQLSAFIHNGFWHPMDTLKDKKYLEDLWETNQAPWKIW